MARKIEQRGNNQYRLSVSAGYDAQGKQIVHRKTITATSDRAAQKEYALFVAEIERGEISNSGKMTLAQFYDYWRENYAIGKHEATTLAYNEHLFARVKAALGNKLLSKIEPRHLLAFYKNLAEPGIKKQQNKKDSTDAKLPAALSPGTVRKHHVLLSTLFNKAVQWNFIPYNPASRVEPPKFEYKTKEIYTQEQLGHFLEEMENEPIKYKTMIFLALACGLRREEIFGLQWKHIDMDKKTVKIEQACVYTKQTGTIIKEPKNKTSNRPLTFPAYILPIIKQHKADQLAARLELGSKWKGAAKPEDDFVFPKWDGSIGWPYTMNKWLREFVASHNLPHITPHIFRHMAATYLITAGHDFRTVSGKLGHSQTTTTMNIYSHLLESAEQETANTMDAFLHQTTAQAKQKKKA